MAWDALDNWERTNAINQTIQAFGTPFEFSRAAEDDIKDNTTGGAGGYGGAFSFAPIDDDASSPSLGACYYDESESKLKYIWLYFGRTLLGEGGEQMILIQNSQYLYAKIDHSYAGQPTLTFETGGQIPASDLVTTYRALWYRDDDGNLVDMRCAPQIPAYL